MTGELDDPCWLPHRLDARRGQVEFIHLPPAVRRAATFLGDDYLPRDLPRRSVALSFLAGAPPPLAETHFVLHAGFAASTLLGRALEASGAFAALQEPAILNDLAAAPAGGGLEPILPWLCRRRPEAPALLVKPSNSANALAEPMLDRLTAARAVLVAAPLPAFLASVARRGLFGRLWARRLWRALERFVPAGLGLDAAQREEITDLQAAGLAWLLHCVHFEVLLARHPGRTLFLWSTSLVEAGRPGFLAAARFLLPEVDEARLATVADGPVFAEHSKRRGESFDAQASGDPGGILGEEIGQVARWAEAVARSAGLESLGRNGANGTFPVMNRLPASP